MPNLDIKITSMYPPGTGGSTRAYASATIDGCLAVRGIKVVEGGRDGLFVSMPSRKTQDGYKEVCFPVTVDFREKLHTAVLDTYKQALTMAQADVTQQTGQAAPEQEAPTQESGIQMAGM